jgi:hypothetical protein
VTLLHGGLDSTRQVTSKKPDKSQTSIKGVPTKKELILLPIVVVAGLCLQLLNHVLQLLNQTILLVNIINRVVDPHHLYADPDPAFHSNADPDPDEGSGSSSQ